MGEDEPQLDAERPAADHRPSRRRWERSRLAVELMTHLVGVTFPTCSSASAMHHVFDCPGWLRSWCARHSVPCKDVSVLQLTLYDATGQSSNAMYFPLV